MKSQNFTIGIDDLRRGLASILYEIEQMLSARSEMAILAQEHPRRRLSLGTEIALLESFLVHIRNLDDLYSKPKRGNLQPTILCDDYGFDKADVLDKDDRKLINTYMSHLSYDRVCLRDTPHWDLTRFGRVYESSLKFLSHIGKDSQLVDGEEQRIKKIRRDLRHILSPGKTDKHSDPPTEAFTTSSDSPH